MKRNTILTLVTSMLIGVAAFGLWRAGATTTIGAGYDQFATPDNAVTHEDISLGAGFFTNAAGKPSNAFSGTITFKGGAPVQGFVGDTVIERMQDVVVPGDTSLVLYGLRLVSVGTVHVTFTDGSAADYNVSVKESPSQVSSGTMHFSADGTFSNSLQINRQYTFTSTGQPTRTLDSAAAGWAAISLTSTGTWQMSNGPVAESSEPGTLAAIAPSTGGVVVRPNTHQAIIAQHATTMPSPSPSPCPRPRTGCSSRSGARSTRSR